MLATTLTTALTFPAAAAGWYLAPMAARRVAERRLRRACAEQRTLVLTYDDGPGPILTGRLLERLERRGVKATFFLAGFRAQQHSEVVEQVVAAGHEVGCHGHDHVNAWRSWPWRSLADMKAGYRTLARWVGRDGIFRPPHGKLTAATWAALARRGAPIGWWTIAGGDVQAPLPEAARAAHEARRAGGGVVLLHDFDRDDAHRQFVLTATELLIDAAEEEGWTIATLGELTQRERKHAA